MAGLGPYEILAMSSGYAKMSTHVGKDILITLLIKALKSVAERAELYEEPVVSGRGSDFTP